MPDVNMLNLILQKWKFGKLNLDRVFLGNHCILDQGASDSHEQRLNVLKICKPLIFSSKLYSVD